LIVLWYGMINLFRVYENQTKIPPHHCEFKAQKKEI